MRFQTKGLIVGSILWQVVTPEHVAYPLLDMLCEAATGAVAALAKPI